MRIRKMTQSDIPAAVELEQECFSQPWSERSFMESLSREDTIFLVCVDDKEQLLGYMGMYLSFEEADITNVAVSTAARRQGCGQRLIEAAQSEAAKRGVERILLEVRVSNAPAIALYEKMGFESIGIRKNFYDFPKEDAMLMSCIKE